MKPIKFLTAVAAAVCIGAAFLPFWGEMSMWSFMSETAWQAYSINAASVLALALSALAIQQGQLRRLPALLIAVSFGFVAGAVAENFVPIFDSSAGVIEDLMKNGAIGAKALFFAAAAGCLLALVGVLKAERRVGG